MDFCLPGVVKIPKANSFLEGALLEPVNTVLKGVRMLPLLPDDTVLIAGQGPVGLLFTRLLSLQKVRVIASDLLPSRRALARKWGAWRTIDASTPDFVDQIKRLTRGRGADAAVVAVPSDSAVAQAQDSVRGGATTLLFAHTVRGKTSPVDLGRVCVDEKSLSGSYSSDFTLQDEVAQLVFSRRLDVRPLITHCFPLDRTAEAIALAANPTSQSLKIVVTVEPAPSGN
jgi:L-iditol 2-dehydrogenase